ncbi:MAG: alkaline phosphatase family protein [Solirubrobacterales bacterium]
MPRKLVLCVIDSLKTEMLERCVAEGTAPTLAGLLERGTLIPDCVSAFPSVTPVCCASITTGTGVDRHHIPAMNWFHRAEDRYVEYGSSLAAVRSVGFLRSMEDTVYNMNMAHLNPRAETVFERLEDAGVSTACTPFLSYRGRTRHEMGLEGVMGRVVRAADFRWAVWGPTELFYGELYASRRVDCAPTLGRPTARDPYSGCVGEHVVRNDLVDFLLFSLPDNDYYSHRDGPVAQLDSIPRADEQLARLVSAAGGIDAFCDEYAVIVMADHSQTTVREEFAVIDLLAGRWRVRHPAGGPESAELAVSPSSRAASVYVLGEGRRRELTHRRVRETLADQRAVDVVTWLADGQGRATDPLQRGGRSAEAVVRTGLGTLRFRPGTGLRDRRGGQWDLEGDPAVLAGTVTDGCFASDEYPDALGRLWSALTAPSSGDILCSLARGYEAVDWGGSTHVPGGSHGSLHAGDSLSPLVFVGCGPQTPSSEPEQWTLRDVAPVVLDHFGVPAQSEQPGEVRRAGTL